MSDPHSNESANANRHADAGDAFDVPRRPGVTDQVDLDALRRACEQGKMIAPQLGLALLDRIATGRREALEEAARRIEEAARMARTYHNFSEELNSGMLIAANHVRALAAGEEPQQGPRGTT